MTTDLLRGACALALLVSVLGCERAPVSESPSKIPFPPKTCEVGEEGRVGEAPAEPAFTLVTGSEETIAEQWQKPRYVNFFPPKTFAQMSELREESWRPEGDAPPTERGTYEVTVFPCGTEWTERQEREANELIAKTRAAAEKHGWFDYDKAVADGFYPMLGLSDHYVNDEFAHDGRILDPDRPEFLMYYDTDHGRVLSGVMYVMPGIGLRGPQIGGPQTIWHYHVMPAACYLDGIAVEIPAEDGTCSRGVRSEISPEMIHVWFIDRENGPFSSAMLPPAHPPRDDAMKGH